MIAVVWGGKNMESRSFLQHFNELFAWVYRLAYVTVLWWAFVILGLGVFGTFPATTAMFAVMRKWILVDPDIPLFQTFWSTYKREFLTSNATGYLIGAIGAILAWNFYLLTRHPGGISSVAIGGLSVVSAVYVAVLSLLFPVLVHFDLSPLKSIQLSFILAVTQPIRSLLLLCAIGLFAYCGLHIGGFVTVFFASIFGLVIIRMAYFKNPVFQKIHLASPIRKVGSP